MDLIRGFVFGLGGKILSVVGLLMIVTGIWVLESDGVMWTGIALLGGYTVMVWMGGLCGKS